MANAPADTQLPSERSRKELCRIETNDKLEKRWLEKLQGEKPKVNLIVGEMFFKSLLHKVYEQEKSPGGEGGRYFFFLFSG